MRLKVGGAALALGMVCVPMASAHAQASFSGAGQETELDCDGSTVHIAGADNHVTVRGGCSALVLEGAGNHIVIDLAAQSSIRVQGAGNEVRWSAPGKARPKLAIAGADNRVSRMP